jgi:hypothetical protein
MAPGLTAAVAAAPVDLFTVTFELRNVENQLVEDPEARFTFRSLSDQHQIGKQILKKPLKAAPLAFELPVQFTDVAICDFDLLRYRFATSETFFRGPDPVARNSPLMREPLQWTPEFTKWNGLTEAFDDLKKKLGDSDDVRLFKTQISLGKLVEDDYDNLSDAASVLAKTALLNLYYRLRTLVEPTSKQPWFSFVNRIHAIGRERFLAFVDPRMADRVQDISDHIGQFPDYERTEAANHRGNVPADMQSRIIKMVSIKSSETTGNIQLTMTRLSQPDEVLLDTDIDENGQLFLHFLDLFKHRITGGTHPNDIHELLVAKFRGEPGFDLGYKLV